jgi:hypothetical protein
MKTKLPNTVPYEYNTEPKRFYPVRAISFSPLFPPSVLAGTAAIMQHRVGLCLQV